MAYAGQSRQRVTSDGQRHAGRWSAAEGIADAADAWSSREVLAKTGFGVTALGSRLWGHGFGVRASIVSLRRGFGVRASIVSLRVYRAFPPFFLAGCVALSLASCRLFTLVDFAPVGDLYGLEDPFSIPDFIDNTKDAPADAIVLLHGQLDATFGTEIREHGRLYR